MPRQEAEGLNELLVGVVPAAGYATRLQPMSGSKEVYPIAGKPVMDYLVEKMTAAGCSDIRVVTRPERTDVVSHATATGLRVVEAYPRSVSESLLHGLTGIDDTAVVIFGFPDTIWEPPDGFLRLTAALRAPYDVALGVFTGREPERSDVVVLDASGRVTEIQVKPRRPRSNLIWGCCAARAWVLRAMQGIDEPGDYFNSMCQAGRIAGVYLSDEFIDIGTRERLRELTQSTEPGASRRRREKSR
ncbi:MAG: NTP transferase domain-containing protein [Actinomycetota bacterium]|nr:NTP transferase domain-containing protein [Actinomycetota bacterium]